jgi:antitoxin ParD1/3/4
MVNISASIPEKLKEFIDYNIESGRYVSVSDYIRDLIRADHARRAEKERKRIEELLLDGLNSGKPVKWDKEYFETKSKKFAEKFGIDTK